MRPESSGSRHPGLRGARVPGNPRNSRLAWLLLLGLLAVGCLEDHPVVGGGNVVNLEEYFLPSGFPPGMATLEVHLADDSLRPVRLHWSGAVTDLARMPRYLKGDQERVRLRLRGLRPTGTHCYTADIDGRWEDRRELLNTCPDTPSVALTVKGPDLLLGDSLIWYAHVKVKYGTLSRWRLETGLGDAESDSLPGRDDSAFVGGWIRGRTLGPAKITFTIWTGTGIESRVEGNVVVRPRIETLPPPEIQSITASDTAVSINDTLTFNATVRAFGSTLRHRWGGQEGILPIPAPGEPMVLQFRTAFKDAGWRSLELELAGAAPSETASGRTPKVNVLLDPPVVSISLDTVVTAGTQITLKAAAVQRFGFIERSEWQTPRGALEWPGLQTRTVTAPDSPGVYSYTLAVWDDDGNMAVSVKQVAVLADSGAYLISLGVSGGPLTPAFQTGTTHYLVEVPYESTLVTVTATAKSAASTLLAAGITDTGKATWPVVLKTGPNPVPILVTDTAGRKVSYLLNVIRKPFPSEPARIAYATVYVEPMTGRPPAVWDSYSSNGKGPAFVPDAAGSYQLIFPGIYQGGSGQPNVQVSAQGDKPARCVVNWSAMAGDLNLFVNCYGANGLRTNSGFTVLAVFPRAAATGANAHAQVDTLPGATPRALGTAYNSSGKPVTVQSLGKGVYSTVFEGFPIGTAPAPMVTRLGDADGFCGADTAKAAGSGTQVIVRCFDRNGTPEDARYSLALNGPLGEGLAFHLAHAACREMGGGPNYNSSGGPAYCTGRMPGPTGTPYYGVAFTAMGFQPRSAAGNIQVSARAKDGKVTCQVVDWQGWPDATAKVACFDRAGNPALSDLYIWDIKAK